jgi:hypothetical protein
MKQCPFIYFVLVIRKAMDEMRVVISGIDFKHFYFVFIKSDEIKN